MVGVIWVIQLVHYPLFRHLDPKNFRAAHQFHSTAISFIVIPVMSAELLLSILLWTRRHSLLPTAGILILILIWAVTFTVMIPLHARLQTDGFQPAIHRRLLYWNWVRTIAWSLRGILMALLLLPP